MSGFKGPRLRLLLPAVALACLCAGAAFSVEPKSNFSPQVQAKIDEFMKRVTEAKRKVWTARMKKEIDDVAAATGLGEDGKKALADPAKTAVDECVGEWGVKMAKLFNQFFTQQPAELIPELDQLIQQADFYAANEEMFSDYMQPIDHPAWTGALRKILTPGQAALWAAAQRERKKAIEDQMGELLKATVERMREQYAKAIQPRTSEIKVLLALPKDRAAKLEDLAKIAVDKSAEEAGKRGEKMLLGMNEDQRLQIVKNRQFFVQTEPKDQPDRQSAWTDGLAKFLSADELKRLQDLRQEHKARRIQIWGRIMLSELDERIAFTSSQRARLEPVMEQAVKDSPDSFSEEESEMQNMQLAPQRFLPIAAKVPEKDIKPILDDAQWARWQDVVAAKGMDPNQGDLQMGAMADNDQTAKKPDPDADPKRRSPIFYMKRPRSCGSAFSQRWN